MENTLEPEDFNNPEDASTENKETANNASENQELKNPTKAKILDDTDDDCGDGDDDDDDDGSGDDDDDVGEDESGDDDDDVGDEAGEGFDEEEGDDGGGGDDFGGDDDDDFDEFDDIETEGFDKNRDNKKSSLKTSTKSSAGSLSRYLNTDGNCVDCVSNDDDCDEDEDSPLATPDDPCTAVKKIFQDSFDANGNVTTEKNGFLVVDINTGDESFVAINDPRNNASQSYYTIARSVINGVPYIITGGSYYQIVGYVHTHPNTGINPATGGPYIPGPSEADIGQIKRLNTGVAANVLISGYILAASGTDAYEYTTSTTASDSTGINDATNLGNLYTWITNQFC